MRPISSRPTLAIGFGGGAFTALPATAVRVSVTVSADSLRCCVFRAVSASRAATCASARFCSTPLAASARAFFSRTSLFSWSLTTSCDLFGFAVGGDGLSAGLLSLSGFGGVGLDTGLTSLFATISGFGAGGRFGLGVGRGTFTSATSLVGLSGRISAAVSSGTGAGAGAGSGFGAGGFGSVFGGDGFGGGGGGGGFFATVASCSSFAVLTLSPSIKLVSGTVCTISMRAIGISSGSSRPSIGNPNTTSNANVACSVTDTMSGREVICRPPSRQLMSGNCATSATRSNPPAWIRPITPSTSP